MGHGAEEGCLRDEGLGQGMRRIGDNTIFGARPFIRFRTCSGGAIRHHFGMQISPCGRQSCGPEVPFLVNSVPESLETNCASEVCSFFLYVTHRLAPVYSALRSLFAGSLFREIAARFNV